jgi:hypothetical protein
MKKIYIIIIVFIVLIIGSTIVIKFTNKVLEMTGGDPSEYYRDDIYTGVVIKKLINREQHNYRTIIIEQDDKEQVVLFSFVTGGLYEFIEVGDTLSKKSGSLDLRLKRKDLDTLITMQIYDRRNKNKNGNE